MGDTGYAIMTWGMAKWLFRRVGAVLGALFLLYWGAAAIGCLTVFECW